MIKAWLECKRKFAWDYIDLIPRRHTPATEFGELTHNQAEQYLSTGTCDQTSPHGQLVATGFHLLPPPKLPGMSLEKFFEFELQGVLFHGTKDVEIHTSQYCAVFDHKTTSDWRWAKTEQALRADPQVLIYSMDSMIKTGHRTCHCAWTYFKKRGRYEARQVRFVVTYDEVIQALQPYVQISKQIIAETRKVLMEGVEPAPSLRFDYTVESCSKYGGCQYIERCNLNPTDTIGRLFRGKS